MSESVARPLNQSIKQSIDPSYNKKQLGDSVASSDVISAQNSLINKGVVPKKLKIMAGCGICLLILGLILFLALPPLLHSMIISTVNDQAVLSKDNQDMWAHVPGQTGTVITRNYSFFQLENAEQWIIHGKKPVFTERQGWKIQQFQDFLDIQYFQDGNKVRYRDWLHFEEFNQSKSLDDKVSILNVPKIGFWNVLKKSRDAIIFLQGFALMFMNIQNSIVDTVVGQGISSQYLTDFNSTYSLLLQPAGISQQNSKFIWQDDGYGLYDKNNIKYWVQAARTSFTHSQPSFSMSAIMLKDYFTLSNSQMYFILASFNQFIQSLQDLIIKNHYCQGLPQCSGRELAIRQIAQSYVTFNTPPVSSITPSDTICQNNDTCFGYYPELAAYYKRVYLKQHPQQDPFLKFDVQMVRKWTDYNPKRIVGQYNKAPSALMHIGNLDALFDNGTLHDQNKKDYLDTTPYLFNIKNRFELPTVSHTRVFWEWIKYIASQLIRQNTGNNQKLGMSNTFSSAITDSFFFLQDNLQLHVLRAMIKNKLDGRNCLDFIRTSFQNNNERAVQQICSYYQANVSSDSFITDSIRLCRNQFREQWKKFISLGAQNMDLNSFCDITVDGGFGQLYNNMRIQIDQFYNCDHTPNQYCSDYQLALKQWANGTVTRNQPRSAGNLLKNATTFNAWNSSCPAFEYYHYTKKFVQKPFPIMTMQECYHLFTYDAIFSASANVRVLKNSSVSQSWKDYMRYVIIFVGLTPTTTRTVRQFVLGYDDEYLLWRKKRYPPEGGDPSTPSYTAFNDLNLTADDAKVVQQLHTGKDDGLMSGQYFRINNLTYIAQNYSRFNGNQTYWVLQSPWKDIDYFYGTNGKKFAADQFTRKNISIYVPNLQRYGSATIDYTAHYTRYGYQLQIGELGEYMYLPQEVNPDNKKYYQHYYGLFNQTSVLGFPFFMSKHHLLNTAQNWTTFIQVYDENHTKIQPVENHFQNSFILYQPYSGVAFQSVLFIQASYMYQPDELFTNQQQCLIPVFSVYRSGNMTQQTANKLFTPLTTALTAKKVFFIIGIIMTVVGIALFIFSALKIQKIRKEGKEVVVVIEEYDEKKTKKAPRKVINQQKQSVLTNPLVSSVSEDGK